MQPEQPAVTVEEPALALDLPVLVPPSASKVPSDPSFKLPEGMDPLSAVLLRKQPDQATSEGNSASEDGNNSAKLAATEPAATSTSKAAASPALPLPPASSASAPVAAAAPTSAALVPSEAPQAAAPKLTPPPWATAGVQHPHPLPDRSCSCEGNAGCDCLRCAFHEYA